MVLIGVDYHPSRPKDYERAVVVDAAVKKSQEDHS
jgi:hypothetical protein